MKYLFTIAFYFLFAFCTPKEKKSEPKSLDTKVELNSINVIKALKGEINESDIELKSPNSDTAINSKPKKKKVWTWAEIQALDKRQKKRNKEWAENGAMESVKSYINPAHAARVFSFDSKATNFDRYKNSPCYNKLGFSPFGDLKEQEKRYLNCEEVYYKKRNKNLLIYSGLFLLLASIVYIGIKRRQYH
jgi:hypothetical protein